MVLNISESGVLLESSAKSMAGLPPQAFAITLSGSVIEDMIACVQGGGDIQLSLGSSPKFLFDDHEVRIPKTSDPSGYDLFWANFESAPSASKLPSPTMSIFRAPKHKLKAKAPKASKLPGKGEATGRLGPARAPAQPTNTTSRPSAASAKEDSQEKKDEATAQLERSLAKAAADKRENSALLVTGLPSSKGRKMKPGQRLLSAQTAASPRSLPPSPALSATPSPSSAPSGNAAEEKSKQQRFPIIHELAVQELSTRELFAKWEEGTEDEFKAALSKVADFDKDSQKWVLKQRIWKELDVFEYDYAKEDDRQRAINNAIRQYDRQRLSSSDPLWQKLLPKAERGKGICLSRLQAAIAKGPAPPAPKQKTDAASGSGADSEKDDSASSGTRKSSGGTTMSRSSSQASTGKKKLSASETQAKRMLSTSKKPAAAATTAKAGAPKASSTKAAAKGTGAKGGRVLSKEFVSDSSSDDEVPLSTSTPKVKASAAPASKPAARAIEKAKDPPLPKPKPAPTSKVLPRDEKKDKVKDTIRPQVVAKPPKPPVKRPRDDDDDSSSSGTPLSKRVKPAPKPLPAPVTSGKARTASDASQNSRGSISAVAAPKIKKISPTKSSPLALSPPTNASDAEQERLALTGARERERERDDALRGSSSNTDSGGSVSIAKKRPLTDSVLGNKTKRQRLSEETMEKAAKFKQFYARYEQLHHDIVTNGNPDPSKVTDLLDMHKRLSRMKDEIYAAVEA